MTLLTDEQIELADQLAAKYGLRLFIADAIAAMLLSDQNKPDDEQTHLPSV